MIVRNLFRLCLLEEIAALVTWQIANFINNHMSQIPHFNYKPTVFTSQWQAHNELRPIVSGEPHLLRNISNKMAVKS